MAEEQSTAENRGSTRTQTWLDYLAMIDENAANVSPLRARHFRSWHPSRHRVGELLKSIEEWWASGGFKTTREECLVKLQSLTD